MRHDVRDRLAVHRQNNSFPGLHGVNHLAGAITQVANPDFHVRHRSTIRPQANVLHALPASVDPSNARREAAERLA